MIKYLKEFSNTGNSSNSTINANSNKTNPLELAKKYKFKSANSNAKGSEVSGLVIGSSGMVAVQYDISKQLVMIRPDNNLSLGPKELTSFKQDLNAAEKLAKEISKISKPTTTTTTNNTFK